MKTSNVLVLILVLLYMDASTEWPTHTVCKEDNLEIHYKSCDPQQDFAFSIDRCSDVTTHTFNIRAAMVLNTESGHHFLREATPNTHYSNTLDLSLWQFETTAAEVQSRDIMKFVKTKEGEHCTIPHNLL